MAEFKRTQRDYPLSFKIAVVEQVEKGEMTYKQAQLRYGIQGRSTVLTWLLNGQLNWAQVFFCSPAEFTDESTVCPFNARTKHQRTRRTAWLNLES